MKDEMPRSNRDLGNRFERWFCNELYKHGWWVYNCPQNAYGQPADVIACNGPHTILVDCKVCSVSGFPFIRVEENQANSMTMFESRTDFGAMFAFKLADGEVWMIDWIHLKCLIDKGWKHLTNQEIKDHGYPLEALWEL